MTATVGEGIQAAMNAAQDTAVTSEWTEFHDGAKVVKAWGLKGLYIASDDSGAWLAAGPFG